MSEAAEKHEWDAMFKFVATTTDDGEHKLEVFESSGRHITKSTEDRKVDTGINYYPDRVQIWAIVNYAKGSKE